MIFIDKKALGRRIRAIRLQLGLTMEDFIERIDSKPGRGRSGTVNNWETGKNAPNKKRLQKIAELGGVSVEYLINGVKLNVNDFLNLVDKSLNAPLNKKDYQRINASQLGFFSSLNKITAIMQTEAQNKIKKEQAIITNHPLSILDLKTYGDFLALLNLIRRHGSDDQSRSFNVLINMIWQIATGRIKYDKNDLLPNIDKFLSSFPIKEENKKD
ncbi:helix-turn-helix transcriptional regulator [Limosilactobacillus reuteri]|uniref:helix-turn-helix domain-containing protein n=1 Tax=Limosilactobacillus reuteri TaxID=1598 RepID=UPI002F260E01